MTTIAYRNGVLAADSRCMLGGWKSTYPLPKLFRLKDGSVCGICGDYASGLAFKDWLDSDHSNPRPTLAESTVIQMTVDGLTIHEDGASFPVTTEFAAWGSGSPAANGALHMGADAVKAVQIAALLDDGTGGDVTFMARLRT